MSSPAVTRPSKSPVNQSNGPSPPQSGPRRFAIADIVTKSRGLPSRMVIHGLPGVGKTLMSSFSESAIFVPAEMEQGIERLMDSGVLERAAFTPECRSWSHLLEIIDTLTREDHEYKTFVGDVVDGYASMCADHVCARDFGNKRKAFTAWGEGPKVTASEWGCLLKALDRLREIKKMRIILLSHTGVEKFKNPEGADYLRYVPDMHSDIWAKSFGWSDIAIFANFLTVVKDEGGKFTGAGGSERYLYTTRTAAWDAKNAANLPDSIPMGSNGQEAWSNFTAAMQAARASIQSQSQKPQTEKETV